MPDLGKYAFAVLSSYGATITLVAIIVLTSIRRSAKVKRQLQEIEARKDAQN